MLRSSCLLILPVLFGGIGFSPWNGTEPRTELKDPAFRQLPLGSIRPEGYLREQLRIQADGLTGHLDEFWPDIRNSGWTGGDAEGWERLPYWLDGLVPLAYLLDDQHLIHKVETTIDYILEHQNPDGWLGPERSPGNRYRTRDPWPVFVAMKALIQYESVAEDTRVEPALVRFLQALDRQLESRPLFDWNRMRWQDGLLSVDWLYERTQASWLLDLAGKLHRQGFDWIGHFDDLPYREKVSKWEHESHVVNNAMGVKTAALWYRHSGDSRLRDAALEAIRALDRYHGQAAGIFSGDENFAGLMPSQGTETCAVVEYLFSLEKALEISGNPAIGDRLEMIAYNALPAPFKPDMWARQYVQQSNQPIAKVSPDLIYTTNGKEANLYGLETNYGCCTANMHQGWPKFAAHLWMTTPDGGLAAVAYAPSTVRTVLGGREVSVTLQTRYPFDDILDFRIEADRPAAFPLLLRIPAWTQGAWISIDQGSRVPVRSGTFHRIEKTWSGQSRIRMQLPMRLEIERRFNQAVSLKRGPIVYSLNIREYWKILRGKEPHADWEVFPASQWNYALEIDPDRPEDRIRLESDDTINGNPFSPEGAPIRLYVNGRLLPEWTLEKNAAAPPPPSPVHSVQPRTELELIPYGAAKLRITEFPWIRPD